jgi:hypothetical protein
MSTANEDERIERRIRRLARRRVGSKVGFIWHVAVFVMANLTMFAIDERYSPGTSWFLWPLFGWGAGLLFHALAVLSGTGMTEEMIRDEIARERRRRGLA